MQVRCPVVVGREAELAAVGDVLASAAAGDGRAVFLTGEPGIGKSALLREAMRVARGGGVRMLLGRAVPGPSPVPFRPLAEALLAALRHEPPPDAQDLVPFRPALSRLIPHWRAAEDRSPDASLVVLGEGVLRLLRAICPEGCVLVLDDLQWADPETLAVVEYLCDNLAGEPIGVLAAARDVGRPALIDALFARHHAAVLHLDRLSSSAVAQMVAACPLPDGFPAERAAEVSAAAEGVPLLVEEVLALAADPAPDPGRRVPPTVTETVRHRLADLGHDARTVLACAALLGRRFDWRLLARASDLSEQAVHEALRAATERQLLDSDADSFRFRHALTRDAVLAAVLPPDVVRIAEGTRAAVEAAHPGLPDEWCSLAAELAERAGDRDGAAGLLVTAGRRALGQGALVTAEGLLRHAVGLAATADRAAEADEVLAAVLAAAGRVDEAAAIARARLAVKAYEPGRRVRLQLLIARAAIAGERWQLAGEQLEDARAAAEGFDDLAAQHEALRAQVAVGAGRNEEALRAARAALRAAERTGQPEVACEALEVIGRVERLRSLPAARVAFERGVATAEANGLVLARLRALHELGTVDMFEKGELDRLFQARSLALDAGALTVNAVLDVQLAGGLWLRGEGAECIAAGRRAADAGRRFRIEGIRRAGLCFAAIGHAPLIDPAGLEAGAAALADETDDPGWTAALWGDGWCVYALLTEDRQGAVRSMEMAAELGRAGVAPMPSPWWGLWPLLRAVRGGDAEEALAVTERGVPDRWNEMMSGYARAVALGRRGLSAQADAAYARADDAGVPWWWWRQLGRRLAAEAALQDHWGEPVPWLREAATFFDGFPAPAVASACRSMLRRAGVVPPPARRAAHLPPVLAAHGVTGREAEVLRLVGQGLSNREVGERLFLSPRTVEKHVENIGRKLGVTTRSQMVAYGASLDRTT